MEHNHLISQFSAHAFQSLLTNTIYSSTAQVRLQIPLLSCNITL